jgi:hypothetical protein
MMKLKFSNKIKAIKYRVDRLPKMVERKMDSKTKKYAERFIEIFQFGIQSKAFHLEPLAQVTIEEKERKQYSQPTTPLFGLGDEGPNTLLNTFAIRKVKNGWRVYPRKAKHHEADMTLEELQNFHENGALIGLPGGKIIRIPPRPARRLAYETLLRAIYREDPTKEMREAISGLINEGKESK